MAPGTMVELHQRHIDVAIKARRLPQRFASPRTAGTLTEHIADVASNRELVVGIIPSGTDVLYVSSKRDAFSALMAGKSASAPFGFRPGDVTFYLVLWGEKPVWVSSEDCDVKER